MADTRHTKATGKAAADSAFPTNTNGDVKAATVRQAFRDVYESMAIGTTADGSGVRTSVSTLTITSVQKYVFTGSTAVWTMPVGAGVIWEDFPLINNGTGNIIIQNDEDDAIFTIYPGTRYTAFYDGTEWIFIG